MQQVSLDDIRDIVGNVIGDPKFAGQLSEESRLLGAIPELDSMAVVNLLMTLEQRFGFHVDDDEVEIEIFDTLGALQQFAQGKLDRVV